MSALLDSHQVAERAAIDFAQTVIRTGFAINAGAIIAIPAITSLFGLESNAIMGRLLFTGSLFAFGICAAWLAGILGFFTLAHKSGDFYTQAVKTARLLESRYFPHLAELAAKQAADAEKRARRLQRLWIIERYFAIALSFASLIFFLWGSWVGVHAVLMAPHRIVHVSSIVPTAIIPTPTTKAAP